VFCSSGIGCRVSGLSNRFFLKDRNVKEETDISNLEEEAINLSRKFGTRYRMLEDGSQ
jgi:hypothetical protein